MKDDATATEPAALAIIERYRPAITAELRSVLEQRTLPPFTLMRYHLGWQDEDGKEVESRGGKLLRPALCLLCCEAVGGDWQRALPGAAALELVHNFSLIHDDVEDASRQRRGRETLWSLVGEAQAINVGDGMFALAHVALLQLADLGHEAERVLAAVRLLDDATIRLCEGQHRDLLYEEERRINAEDYLRMIEGKTAVLLAASCGMGALLGGASDHTVAAFYEFGRRTGLAFQVRDDVLGVWGDPIETGKPAGDDLRQHKQSYPVVVALERANAEQRGELQALLARDPLGDSEVERAVALLEHLGAREECERGALEHAEAAVAVLSELDLQPDPRRELERLARFSADRRA